MGAGTTWSKSERNGMFFPRPGTKSHGRPSVGGQGTKTNSLFPEDVRPSLAASASLRGAEGAGDTPRPGPTLSPHPGGSVQPARGHRGPRPGPLVWVPGACSHRQVTAPSPQGCVCWGCGVTSPVSTVTGRRAQGSHRRWNGPLVSPRRPKRGKPPAPGAARRPAPVTRGHP